MTESHIPFLLTIVCIYKLITYINLLNRCCQVMIWETTVIWRAVLRRKMNNNDRTSCRPSQFSADSCICWRHKTKPDNSRGSVATCLWSGVSY